MEATKTLLSEFFVDQQLSNLVRSSFSSLFGGSATNEDGLIQSTLVQKLQKLQQSWSKVPRNKLRLFGALAELFYLRIL